MQTLTFTQKLLRQRGFLRALIPLLAIFVSLGASQTALAQAAYDSDYVTISAAPISPALPTNTTYAGNASGAIPFFEGADLGKGGQFDQSAGGSTLLLTAATAELFIGSRTSVPSSRVLYRVYLFGTSTPTQPAYTPVSMTLTSPTNNSNPVSYGISGLTIDLLRQPSVLGGGTYVVEVKFESTVNRFSTAMPPITSTGPITDDNGGGNGFQATFKVVPPVATPDGGTTTWISDGISPKDANWLNPLNWSNGAPTRNSNAIIPGHGKADPFTVSPLLNNPTATYEVQNLLLENADANERAIIRLGESLTGGSPTGGTLRVYGDLNQLAGGILASVSGTNGIANPLTNSTIVFAGDAQTFVVNPNSGIKTYTGGNQVIRGAGEIVDVRIEGTGIKGIVNSLNAPNTFTFATTTAIVRTISDDGLFTRNTTKNATVNLKDSGTLFGETNTAFIDGVTIADRTLVAGVKQTFGNIGVDITPSRNILSPSVIITRYVGISFTGPVGTRKSIKRYYGVSGDVNNNTTSTVTFHYFNSTDELNGNPETALTIFKTGNNGVPFQLLGGVYDGTLSITQTGVQSINTITLGDKDNPLPVRLTAFNAKRVGTDALVTWTTASEENSKGYDVQVSTNAKEFRTLTSVPSAAPNTTRTTEYRYIDTEANKNGTRYYRLRQVDLDGKETFFAPVAVSFTGKSVETALVAYPNPFNGNDQLRLAFQSANAGKGQVLITDLTGRVIRKQSLDVAAGTTDLAIDQLSDLNNGIYMVRLTLPSGQVQNLKVVKQ